ncbi:MAG TPA: hypothetical protein VFU51_11445 [Gaiellaceae bacterium]|jgi:hypothetical protein|nr:hypothetical protein [Gaiellaceae bacterium]
MTTTDYLISAALILVVVRQIRGKRLAGASLYVPLALVAYAAVNYLHGVPTAGNDLLLVGVCLSAGLGLGVLCGLFTLVYPDAQGVAYARATGIAAALWVVGISGRLAFGYFAEHGGGPTIARFSQAHALTPQAWPTALILMALAEVVSRTVVLLVRGRRLATAAII